MRSCVTPTFSSTDLKKKALDAPTINGSPCGTKLTHLQLHPGVLDPLFVLFLSSGILEEFTELRELLSESVELRGGKWNNIAFFHAVERFQ